MSLVVNTNVGSLNAQRSLAASGAELKTAMERLSSGSKINSASDDAAGFAIAERMTAQIRGLNMAAKNAGDGLSMLSAIENATNDVTDMLQRMRELAVQAVNDTNTQKDREYLQGEVTALLSEIDRVATQTQYNGQAILDGSMSGKIQVGTEAGQTVEFSISSIKSGDLGVTGPGFLETGLVVGQISNRAPDYSNDSNVTMMSKFRDIDSGEFNADPREFVSIGDQVRVAGVEATVISTDGNKVIVLDKDIMPMFEGDVVSSTRSENPHMKWLAPLGDDFSHEETNLFVLGGEGDPMEVVQPLSGIDLTEDASGALATITAAIEQVAGDRAGYGALQNRLEYTVSNLMNVSEFTTAARSRIADADFAAESARLAKAQVLQQSGTAMLAQANASSQLALSLIR